MRALRQTAVLLSWLFVAASAGWAGDLQFNRQTITLPAGTQGWQMCRFDDIDSDGLADLLVVDPAGNRLLLFRQRASGFGSTPEQIVRLPDQTAWIAPGDVDPHPGLELLISTAAGLVYLQQNAGAFESQPRQLIQANQVFTQDASPLLTSLARTRNGTSNVIPLISAEQVVLYERNSAFEWSPGPPRGYQPKKTSWHTDRTRWMMGSNPSWHMLLQEVFQTNPGETPSAAKTAETDAARKFIQNRKDDGTRRTSGIERLDLNADAREDLVVWDLLGSLELRTDIFVFLRGADDRLPEKPTQVMHCRGVPVTVPGQKVSPLCDLNGDGRHELVLVALKTSVLSSSGAVDVLLSGSVDWTLTVRSFNGAAFSRSPDAAVVITTLASTVESPADRILIEEDFNGDGRPDVLLKRLEAKWDLVLSSTGKAWFTPQPAATFEIPLDRFFEFRDLNNDRLSDLVVRADDQPQLLIFLSRSRRTERSRP